MKAIQDGAALFFLCIVMVLTGISILGIWDVFGDDVILKSFQTMCLVGVVTAVILIGARHFHADDAAMLYAPNPMFKGIRILTICSLVVSAAFLAFLGVLAIWEVIADMDVLYRALGSLAVIAFTSFISIIVCLDREGNARVSQKKSVSAGTIVLIIFLFWIMWAFIGAF